MGRRFLRFLPLRPGIFVRLRHPSWARNTVKALVWRATSARLFSRKLHQNDRHKIPCSLTSKIAVPVDPCLKFQMHSSRACPEGCSILFVFLETVKPLYLMMMRKKPRNLTRSPHWAYGMRVELVLKHWWLDKFDATLLYVTCGRNQQTVRGLRLSCFQPQREPKFV